MLIRYPATTVMRSIFIGVLLLPLVIGCATRPGLSNDAAREAVTRALPPEWSVQSPSPDQAIMTNAYFDEPGIDSLLLLGPRPYIVYTLDSGGRRVAPVEVGRECVEVWFVPDGSSPSFPSAFNPFTPPMPKRIYAARGLSVYAIESAVVDRGKVPAGTGVDAPEVRVSWRQWRREVSHALSQ
jgi:hypothetical protein